LNPNSFVEIHDSTLSAVFHVGKLIEVRLRPAYIHDRGSGWTQNVDLIISDGTIEVAALHLPCDLSDGSLTIGTRVWQNVLPLMLNSVGPAAFEAQTAAGEQIVVVGSSATLVRHGEPCWVEASPFDYNDTSPDCSEK